MPGMTANRARQPEISGSFLRILLTRLRHCKAAAVAPMFALLLIPIAGGIAYAVELGSWQYMQRSAQNAADSAALAAATVATTGGTTTAQMEARAAANRSGFPNGGNISVTSAPTTCPAGLPGGSSCYEAVVTTSMPFSFARVIGFAGSGGGRQNIAARAVAITKGPSGGSGGTALPCFWALSTNSDAILGHGVPHAHMEGCSVFSAGGIVCTGGTLKADYALAASASGSPNCACPVGDACDAGTRSQPVNRSGVTLPPDPYKDDPYKSLATAALSTACPPASSKPPTDGNVSSSTPLVYCGGLSIAANKTLNITSANTVIVIKGGNLDLGNKSKLVTAPGASATIIFDNTPQPFGSSVKGAIEITAPNTSASSWKGVAIYRPSSGPYTTAVLSGNPADFLVTGLAYLPFVDVTINGSVNKSPGGSRCYVLISNTITINGEASFANTQAGCNDAGLNPPTVVVGPGLGARERLVR